MISSSDSWKPIKATKLGWSSWASISNSFLKEILEFLWNTLAAHVNLEDRNLHWYTLPNWPLPSVFPRSISSLLYCLMFFFQVQVKKTTITNALAGISGFVSATDCSEVRLDFPSVDTEAGSEFKIFSTGCLWLADLYSSDESGIFPVDAEGTTWMFRVTLSESLIFPSTCSLHTTDKLFHIFAASNVERVLCIHSELLPQQTALSQKRGKARLWRIDLTPRKHFQLERSTHGPESRWPVFSQSLFECSQCADMFSYSTEKIVVIKNVWLRISKLILQLAVLGYIAW